MLSAFKWIDTCGITDMSKVCVDPWSAGSFGKSDEEGLHLSHTFACLRLYDNENFYAHPIEGINAVINLFSQKVIRVDDYGADSIPMTESNYDAEIVKTKRSPLKPIDVVQPEGVNFKIEAGTLTWDKWSLVIGCNARESLTLHDVKYDDRPILYRASLVVPYVFRSAIRVYAKSCLGHCFRPGKAVPCGRICESFHRQDRHSLLRRTEPIDRKRGYRSVAGVWVASPRSPRRLPGSALYILWLRAGSDRFL